MLNIFFSICRLRARLHGQFLDVHPRAERNDNVVRRRLGDRICARVYTEKESGPNIADS